MYAHDGPLKSVLRPGLYEGDNGRVLCHNCSGITAKVTGRDLSGRKLVRMTHEDARLWRGELGTPMDCERCKVTHANAEGE